MPRNCRYAVFLLCLHGYEIANTISHNDLEKYSHSPLTFNENRNHFVVSFNIFADSIMMK